MWPDLAVSSRCQACWLPGTARRGVKAEAKGARGRRFLAGWAPHLTRPGNSSLPLAGTRPCRATRLPREGYFRKPGQYLAPWGDRRGPELEQPGGPAAAVV